MIVWKAREKIEPPKIPDNYSEIMKVSDGNLSLSVCDMSSFSLQVFLYASLDLKPTQDHPEMLGCDWLNEEVETVEECKFLRDSIFHISQTINESDNLRQDSGHYYIIFDPEKLILLVHEVEQAVHSYMKAGDINLFGRLSKNMLMAEPYMERLNAILFFLDQCIKNNSTFYIEMSEEFDTYMANKVFSNGSEE